MARKLPPFGTYVTTPQWFVNLVAPALEHSTKWIYILVWSNSRWQTEAPCKMSIRDFARAAGTGLDQVRNGLAILIAARLIRTVQGKGRQKCWYLPVLHTPEQAKAIYTQEWRALYPKWVRTVVPVAGTETQKSAKDRTRGGYAFQDNYVEGGKVVPIARAK
ncbi:MAG TPA: hypothetical protein VN442_23300 [Bryobacteraceae bacterium]|nr:hypothetical protein [Bryobacteraceae bacterium]